MVRGQPRRKLLLLLADAVERVHYVQSVDGHRPAEPARAAAHRVILVVFLGRVQRHRVPGRRGHPVSHLLPGTGADGVRHAKAGRSLHPVQIVRVRSRGPHAARSAPVQNRRESHTPVPQVYQGNIIYIHPIDVSIKYIRVHISSTRLTT